MTHSFLPAWLTQPIQELTGNQVELTVLANVDQVHEHFAKKIVRVIQDAYQKRGRCCIVLPVGPTSHYSLCAAYINDLGLDLSATTIIHMDEYLDESHKWLSSEHPLSFRGTMERLFYRRLDRRKTPQVVFPSPEHPEEILATIKEAGGLDVSFAGIGIHGHVAFNEPGSSDDMVNSSTRVVQLHPETITMNASRAWGGWVDGFPKQAITIGLSELALAQEVIFYADGGIWQRTALRKAVLGQPDAAFPVTYLTSSKSSLIVTDKITASGIVS